MFSKVKAVGWAGTIATIIIAVLGAFGIEVGPELAAAIVTVVTFIMGFFKKELVGAYR
jgi:hypothetical protein